MFRRYILPLLALAGVAFAIFTVVWGDKTRPPVQPVSEAPTSPYHSSVSGSGIIEASTENISIGTQIPGIVSKIFIKIGSKVKAGDPLFTIDQRSIRAELATRQAAVQVAEATLAEAKYDFSLYKPLATQGFTSAADLVKKRLVMQKAEAELQQAHAELNSSETELERLTVHAPVDGQVLQLKVHLGEFAPDAAKVPGESPLILLGSIKPLNVRVDVDENDAWRVHAGAACGRLPPGEQENQDAADIRAH